MFKGMIEQKEELEMKYQEAIKSLAIFAEVTEEEAKQIIENYKAEGRL